MKKIQIKVNGKWEEMKFIGVKDGEYVYVEGNVNLQHVQDIRLINEDECEHEPAEKIVTNGTQGYRVTGNCIKCSKPTKESDRLECCICKQDMGPDIRMPHHCPGKPTKEPTGSTIEKLPPISKVHWENLDVIQIGLLEKVEELVEAVNKLNKG